MCNLFEAVLDYELFDPGLIGKGVGVSVALFPRCHVPLRHPAALSEVLARVNHIKKKLVTSDHMILPMSAVLRNPRVMWPDGDMVLDGSPRRADSLRALRDCVPAGGSNPGIKNRP